MKKSSIKGTLIVLHILLLIYSTSGILSKLASTKPFLSFEFILLYGGIIFLLGIYAIVWQQIIKKLPLTVAYANKAITVVWGILWGILFFDESISFFKILGAMIIIAGIVLYVTSDGGEK